MKIAIINDETIETYIGGAALVNDKIMSELKENGHEVDLLIFNKDLKEDTIPLYKHFDYFIFANIAYVPMNILNWIMDNKPFITFRHDIPTVLYTQPPSIFHDQFLKLWQKMFSKAQLSIFISPMQEGVFKAHFQVLNSIVLVPPLDVSSFKNKDKNTRNGCLYIGDISNARGCAKTLDFMKKNDPDSRYTFIGKILDTYLVDYLKQKGATVIDSLPHDEVANYMNDYETLYYFPEIYDSFCLKILEANLCGMKIIADTKRIGIFSYEMSTEEMLHQMNEVTISHIVGTINNTTI